LAPTITKDPVMFQAPPPEIAMRLAEEHRHDLMLSAGKRPGDGANGHNPRSFLCVIGARLGQVVRCLHAARAKSWIASEVARFAEPSSGQRVGCSPVEKASKQRAT
jgi:hypothetical protein